MELIISMTKHTRWQTKKDAGYLSKYGYKPVSLSADEVVQHHNMGCTFISCYLDGDRTDGVRKNECGGVIIDFDKSKTGFPLSEADAELIIEILTPHAFAIVPSTSATPDNMKLHVFLAFDKIVGYNQRNAIANEIAGLVAHIALRDKKMDDATHVCFGVMYGGVADTEKWSRSIGNVISIGEVAEPKKLRKRKAIEFDDTLTPVGMALMHDFEGRLSFAKDKIICKCPNPKHDDRNPSAVFYRDKQQMHCQVCHEDAKDRFKVWENGTIARWVVDVDLRDSWETRKAEFQKGVQEKYEELFSIFS